MRKLTMMMEMMRGWEFMIRELFNFLSFGESEG
jgi:hypothetical protein